MIHRDRDTDRRVFHGGARRLKSGRSGVEAQPPIGCLGNCGANCFCSVEDAGFLASSPKSRTAIVPVAKRRREQIVEMSRRSRHVRLHVFHKLFEQRLIFGASSQTVGRNPMLRLDNPPELSPVGAKILRLRGSLKRGRGSHRHSRPRRSDRGSTGSDRWVCRQDPSFQTSTRTSTPHRRFPGAHRGCETAGSDIAQARTPSRLAEADSCQTEVATPSQQKYRQPRPTARWSTSSKSPPWRPLPRELFPDPLERLTAWPKHSPEWNSTLSFIGTIDGFCKWAPACKDPGSRRA